MQNKSKIAALALILATTALSSSNSNAATCFGSCGQSTAADGVVTVPSNGTGFYRWISTFSGPAGTGQITRPDFPVDNSGATNGSTYVTSPFVAGAGAQLNYDFNYVTSDGQSGGPSGFVYKDYAWAQIRDMADNVIATLLTARTEPAPTSIIPGVDLGPVQATLTPSAVPIIPGAPNWSPLGATYNNTCWGDGCGYTDWVKSSFTIQNAGTYVLVFGVTNWGDMEWDSGLAFSGLTIGGAPIEGEGEEDPIGRVPVPAALPLFASGLGIIGLLARKRKRKQAASSRAFG